MIISRCSAQPVLCYQDGGPVVEVLASSRDPLALLSWRLTSSSALASSTFSLQSMTRFVVYKHFTGTQYYNIMKIENVPKNPHKNHEGREHCCFWLRQQVDQCPRTQWKVCLKGEFFIIIFSIRKYDLSWSCFQKLGGNKLLGPKGVAVADSGEIIVIDNKGSAVFILHPASGKVVLESIHLLLKVKRTLISKHRKNCKCCPVSQLIVR